MDSHPVSPESPVGIAALLRALEERSRSRPDRVLRLRGSLPGEVAPALGDTAGTGDGEPFELLIFRGFSSLTTHPTAVDPDRPALPEGSTIASAELLQAPLIPDAESLLAGPVQVEAFLGNDAWH